MELSYDNCQECSGFKESVETGVHCQQKGYTLFVRKYTKNGSEFVDCMGRDRDVV